MRVRACSGHVGRLSKKFLHRVHLPVLRFSLLCIYAVPSLAFSLQLWTVLAALLLYVHFCWGAPS